MDRMRTVTVMEDVFFKMLLPNVYERLMATHMRSFSKIYELVILKIVGVLKRTTECATQY